MPEVASKIGDGLMAVADGLNQIAGVLAWGAAAEHSDNHGEQSQMAAVIMRFAKEGYFHTRIDRVNVSKATEDQVIDMMTKLWPGLDPRKMRR